MKTYDTILQGHEATEEQAIDWASGFDFSQSELNDDTITFKRYIDTVNGIDVYYDYGADYYFFAPAESTL